MRVRGCWASGFGAFLIFLGGSFPARAQQVVFTEDFEQSFANWSPDGLWVVMRDTFNCAQGILPFPDPIRAAYFGDLISCDFDVGFFTPAVGSLQYAGSIDIPVGQSASLSFDSYEETECDQCIYDNRIVEARLAGAAGWVFLGEAENSGGGWYRPRFDLTAFLGQTIELRFRFDSMDGGINDGLGWVVDGVRIEVVEPPQFYCTGKTNSLGCIPFLTTSGVPSATSTAPFRIVVNDTIDEVGRVWYSFKKSNLNFHGGKLCIKSPLQRLTNKATKQNGVPPCEWTLSRDFNARIQSGLDPQLTPGQAVFAQWRGRDPLEPQGFGDMITDAVRFQICP